MEGQSKASILLLLLATVFLEGIVQPITQGNYISSRAIAFGLLGIGCLVWGVIWWKKPVNGHLKGLRASAEKLANDFRIWLAVFAVIWIYYSAMSVVDGIHRNNELSTLRNDQNSITNVLDRFVLPRQLSESQIQSFGDFIKQFPKPDVAIEVVKGDEEAANYAQDLKKAFIKASWMTENTGIMWTTIPENDLPDILVSMKETAEHSKIQATSDQPKMITILRMGFGLAEMRGNGWQGPTLDQSLVRDRIVITVGHRRRDSYVSPCK